MLEHVAPAAGEDPRLELQSQLNDTLKLIDRYRERPVPVQVAYGSKGAPFAGEQRLLADQALAQIAQRVAAISANVEQFEKFRSALNGYGALLRNMQDALRTLVSALDTPQKLDKLSEDMFALAFTLKKDIEAFRAARKGAN